MTLSALSYWGQQSKLWPGTAKPAEHGEVPFAGSPLTAESPQGDFAVLAATSVAGWPGNPQPVALAEQGLYRTVKRGIIP